MKRRTNKGNRGGSTRGAGRGRGRGSRNGRGGRSHSNTTNDLSNVKGSRASTFSGRGRNQPGGLYHDSRTLHNSSSGNLKLGDDPKVPPDFYLHKKFKKLTNTALSDADDVVASENSSKSHSNSSSINGMSNAVQHSLTVSSSDNSYNNHSAINPPVVRAADNHVESFDPKLSVSRGDVQLQPQKPSCNNNNSNSSGMVTMVYKPKFRIASESEDSVKSSDSASPAQNYYDRSSSQGSTPPAFSSHEERRRSHFDAERVGKVLRLDRQSLDDRISKIIDENQSLLEWPEHFTKKLKSHTSKNSVSPHQRTNQFTMLSGGSTTELLHSPKNHNTAISLTPILNSSHNGLVKHHSFDMMSGGGSTAVEFLTNPLIMKVQADVLQASLSSAVAAAASTSSSHSPTFQLSSAATTTSNVIPKKRRRLSPTPSRLCGGEVSELPVKEVSLSKSYYQDVDMNLRLHNCSGAKVTIRTNNNNHGSSGVNFGRFMESVPSSLSMDNPTPLVFSSQHQPNSILNNSRFASEDSGNESYQPPPPKTLKRKASRPTKVDYGTTAMSIVPLSALDVKVPEEQNQNILNLSHSSNSVSLACDYLPATSSKMLTSGNDEESPTLSSDKAKEFLPPPANNNPKRPTFLALKPVNNVVKKSEVSVLPSPETPRVAKSYNQMSINGNAYTYLGFKVSTRSSYTCLFKPQPMFVPQNNDPKLSMYSNWQPCPKDPKEMEPSMSTNDSRVNIRKDVKTLYTSAVGRNCDTLTVSSPGSQAPITSPMSEKSPLVMFANANKLSSPLPSTRSSGATSHISSLSLPHSSQYTVSPSTRKVAMTKTKPSSMPSQLSSSSDVSSAEDEPSSTCRMERKISDSSVSDSLNPLFLAISRDEAMREREDSNSNSALDAFRSEMINMDSSRVRIMEGGFESNEAYTYVRGRGRGRYVCEACGIRCKKPSMLRKHLKTHTDLRPYTCKLCNFSFKTKGNLTKHQKSKSHHKKCMSMGIHPESQQSLASTGPHMTDSTSDNDSDDDDDDDENCDTDSQDEEGTSSPGNESESVEKEIALSLLDLSKMSRRPSESENSSSGEWSHKQRPLLPVAFSVGSLLGNEEKAKRVADISSDCPMDLTVKTKSTTAPSRSEPEVKRLKLGANGLVRSAGVVTEAQRWEPDADFSTKDSFNLEKVLNIPESNVRPAATTVANSHCDTLKVNNQEIKQEYTGDDESSQGSTFQKFSSISRVRLNSESSNSSMGKHDLPADLKNSDLAQSTAAAASISGVVKLHQPWLSPPEKKALNKERKLATTSTRTSPARNSVESTSATNKDRPAPEGFNAVPNGKVVLGAKPKAEFRQPSGAQAFVKEDGKAECNVCGKSFARASQLTLHMNIHYLERPYRCDPCGVSFRTKGHLIKHRRSSSHDCKGHLMEAWGVANEENPRPFKCPDCKIAFRIHGHLAKHLRSKMHIMRMECLGKLPFGIYFEMEKSGMNMNEIDTTDCDMSLTSLQTVARKIYGETWTERLTIPVEEPAA